MTEKQFIDALIVKHPHGNAPKYVVAKLSLKRAELIAWLQQQTGEWINAEIKESQSGKLYAEVDTWKPGERGDSRPSSGQRRDGSGYGQRRQDEPADDSSIPF